MKIFIVIIISILVSYSVLRYIHMYITDKFEKKSLKYWVETIFTLLIVYISGVAFYYVTYNKPEAIDVYRGNTKLSVTTVIKDNIVIERDSVVIFK